MEILDPCTREPISDTKIAQINSMVKYYYGNNSKNVLITSNMIKNSELHIISYCLYDILRELEMFPSKIEIKNILLPRFIYYINHLLINYKYDEISVIIDACKISFKDTLMIEYLNYIEEKLQKIIV